MKNKIPTEKIEIELPNNIVQFLGDLRPFSGMTVEEYAANVVREELLAHLEALENGSPLFDVKMVKKKQPSTEAGKEQVRQAIACLIKQVAANFQETLIVLSRFHR